ncbi:MAG: hypothetical protein ACR2F8_11595 [Caulobacteraceae bacterium]
MRTLILVAIAALAFGSAANAKPCKDATGKFIKCQAAAAPAATATPAKAAPTKMAAKPAPAKAPAAPMAGASAMAGHHPDCKKGKACGNSCIAVSKVCHKPT